LACGIYRLLSFGIVEPSNRTETIALDDAAASTVNELGLLSVMAILRCKQLVDPYASRDHCIATESIADWQKYEMPSDIMSRRHLQRSGHFRRPDVLNRNNFAVLSFSARP
jgi:hypothetical protein